MSTQSKYYIEKSEKERELIDENKLNRSNEV